MRAGVRDGRRKKAGREVRDEATSPARKKERVTVGFLCIYIRTRLMVGVGLLVLRMYELEPDQDGEKVTGGISFGRVARERGWFLSQSWQRACMDTRRRYSHRSISGYDNPGEPESDGERSKVK